ncbi:hypothetical protein [Streptomyces rimosus]|uniref:hypothetical protein n=1 Tax=Streptomyces rimosus TaxID=1927 RepID=UPI0004C4D70F
MDLYDEDAEALLSATATVRRDRTTGDEKDDGPVHEVHEVDEVDALKRRAVTATRPVPIPPQFVRMLRAYMERFGVAPDGRLFRNRAGHCGVHEQANRLIEQFLRDWYRLSGGTAPAG